MRARVLTPALAAAFALLAAGSAQAQLPTPTPTVIPGVTPTPTPEPEPQQPAHPPVVEATVDDSVTSLRGGPAHANAVSGTIGTPLGLAWTAEVSAGQLLAVPGTLISIGRPGVAVMDPMTGARRWTIAEFVRAAAIVGDAVVVSAGESLSAYALADGTRRWTTMVARGFSEAPVPAGDLVLVQAFDDAGGSAVRALDMSSGAERWRFATPTPGVPAVVGDRVYVPGCGGGYAVLDRRDGHLIHRVESSCHGGAQPIAAAAGRLVRIDNDVAFDMETFAPQPVVRWEAARPGLGLLNTTESTVDGIDPVDSRQHWRAKLPFITGTGLLAGETAVVASREGVAVLDAATGAQRWAGRFTESLHTGSSDGRLPAIAALGSVFVAKGGVLIALRPGAPAPPARLTSRIERVRVIQYGRGFTVDVALVQDPIVVARDVLLAERRATWRRARARVAGRTSLDQYAKRIKLKPPLTTDYELTVRGATNARRFSAVVAPAERTRVRRGGADNNSITWSTRLRVPRSIPLGGRTYALYVGRAGRKRYQLLDAARIARRGRGRGSAVLHFRAPRVGSRDFFRACVSGVSRRGMGWHDRLDRTCGRASVRFSR